MSHQSVELWPGSPFPLGATSRDGGVNFAVASEVADGVELCLFDEAGAETRLPLQEYDAGVWHGFVPGIGPGQPYGFRTTGPYDPSRGLRCNPAKLLLDPYAKAIAGEVGWDERIFGYEWALGPDSRNDVDSAAAMPRSLVVDPGFDWAGDQPPAIPYSDTVIYETHVKGLTRRHPQVPGELQGTYAGLAHPAVIEHLTGLGVTAVELLPVHQSVTNGALRAKGLANYWGYDTIGFFAPHAGYSAAVSAGRPGGQVGEFKQMVRTLHQAGLEVLLDVVFNHTAEGNEYGPTLCLRGLDNPGYYRLVPGDPRHYFDTTGTGNSLNADDTGCLRMILDSLRYWVLDMHVDGFRFDLATTLAREGGDFSRVSSFFDLVAQDPVVSQVKLIAEPWDVGQQDSYALGHFPALWSEWNGRFRDTVRDFWRSQEGTLADFATRVAGSADLYGVSRRRPSASVNLITAHDGFTLRDLVSYDRKHNEENGEGNRDGSDDNRSWNSGAEGPTDDTDVLAVRAARSRAMLATLLLSLGVPMLLGGDELGRSQAGNNNAYCQDGPVSWYDWTAVDTELLAFTRRLLSLRRAHPAFRRRRFVQGARPGEVDWFTPTGQPMTAERWQDPLARAVTGCIDGSRDPDRDARGRPLLDDDLLVLINGYWEPLDFTVPPTDAHWRLALDTARPTAPEAPVPPGTPVTVGARSLLLLVGALTSGE